MYMRMYACGPVLHKAHPLPHMHNVRKAMVHGEYETYAFKLMVTMFIRRYGLLL